MKRHQPCRILMLLENNPYPDDPRVRREAGSLTAAGFHVSVICPGKRSLPRYENINGVDVYRFLAPSPGNGLIGYFREYGWSLFSSIYLASWIFLRHGFDVIHAHNPPDLFVLIAICFRPFGTKFVFDHHDLSPEMYNARFSHGGRRAVFKLLQFFERLSCRWADQIIATNESYRQMEIERSGVSPVKITVVRNGPEINQMKPVPPDPGLRGKAKVILGYVGVMGQQDGVDYLIRAVRHLISNLGHQDIFAVIMGDGSALVSLRQLTDDLDLNEHVWFAGKIQHEGLPPLLSATDICVDPDPYNSYNDRSTMMKMMDYMAMAKPIVAFDLTEHRATAEDAAIYARCNDVASFAENIATLIENPELREKMGDCGRRRMEKKLAWHHQEKNLLQVYANLGYRVADNPDSSKPAKQRDINGNASSERVKERA